MKQLKPLEFSADAIDPARCHVTDARLMAPHEIKDSFSRRCEQLPGLLDGCWSLCGQMTEEMFDELCVTDPSRMAQRLSVFSSSLGAHYLVLTYQLYSRQQRFVLPLWDESVRQGIRELHAGRLKVMVARGEGDRALVFPSGFKPREVEPLLVLESPSPENLLSLLAEMPAAVQTLRQLDAIPGYNGDPLTEVNVAVVAPVRAALSILLGETVMH